METKTKEQAGIDLLAAIDTYIMATIAEMEKEIKSLKRERMEKYVEEHKNDSIHIPGDARGPYAQCLRENLNL